MFKILNIYCSPIFIPLTLEMFRPEYSPSSWLSSLRYWRWEERLMKLVKKTRSSSSHFMMKVIVRYFVSDNYLHSESLHISRV